MLMLEPGGDYDTERFEGADLSGVCAPDVRFLDCVFVSCRMDDVRLGGARVLDTAIVGASASLLQATRSQWRDSTVSDSRLGYLDLSGSTIARVTVIDCKIDFLNLRGTTLRDVRLERVRLGEISLGDASATNVAVTDCTIGVLDLHGGHFTGLDVSASQVEQWRGLASLKGVTISENQAQELACALATELGARVAQEP